MTGVAMSDLISTRERMRVLFAALHESGCGTSRLSLLGPSSHGRQRPIIGANADITATRRYFGEWTISECRGDQHDDLHFSRSLHPRGHSIIATVQFVAGNL